MLTNVDWPLSNCSNLEMAHARNDSKGSISSLRSLSSRASVETYESLKEDIINIEQSQIDLQNLIDTAEKIVEEKLTPSPKKTYTCTNLKGSEPISIDLDGVMKAMLVCGEECGEECEGQCYVASAIVACDQKDNYEDVVETLVALGTTWLTHFLFICWFFFTVSR